LFNLSLIKLVLLHIFLFFFKPDI